MLRRPSSVVESSGTSGTGRVGTGDPAVSPLSLRVNFSWTLVGNVVHAACQWGMLVLLARVGATQMVGEFVFALAITAPIILFANLSLRYVQVTDVTNRFRTGNYVSLRILTTVLAIVVVSAVALVVAGFRALALVIIVVGIAKGIEALSDILHGIFQKRERLDFKARALLIKGPLSLVGFFSTVLITRDLLSGVIAMASIWALILVVFELPRALRMTDERIADRRNDAAVEPPGLTGASKLLDFDYRALASLAWLAAPLGVSATLISLNGTIPRYVAGHSVGMSELGIFGAIAYLLTAAYVVIDALAQAASPRLARYYPTSRRDYSRLLLQVVGLGCALGVAGIAGAFLLGRMFLEIVYGPEYAASHEILVLVAVAGTLQFVSTFLAHGLFAAGYFRIQGVISGIVCAVTLILSLMLVPSYGITGAALVLIASSAVRLVALAASTIHAVLRKPDHTSAVVDGETRGHA